MVFNLVNPQTRKPTNPFLIALLALLVNTHFSSGAYGENSRRRPTCSELTRHAQELFSPIQHDAGLPATVVHYHFLRTDLRDLVLSIGDEEYSMDHFRRMLNAEVDPYAVRQVIRTEMTRARRILRSYPQHWSAQLSREQITAHRQRIRTYLNRLDSIFSAHERDRRGMMTQYNDPHYPRFLRNTLCRRESQDNIDTLARCFAQGIPLRQVFGRRVPSSELGSAQAIATLLGAPQTQQWLNALNYSGQRLNVAQAVSGAFNNAQDPSGCNPPGNGGGASSPSTSTAIQGVVAPAEENNQVSRATVESEAAPSSPVQPLVNASGIAAQLPVAVGVSPAGAATRGAAPVLVPAVR